MLRSLYIGPSCFTGIFVGVKNGISLAVGHDRPLATGLFKVEAMR